MIPDAWIFSSREGARDSHLDRRALPLLLHLRKLRAYVEHLKRPSRPVVVVVTHMTRAAALLLQAQTCCMRYRRTGFYNRPPSLSGPSR